MGLISAPSAARDTAQLAASGRRVPQRAREHINRAVELPVADDEGRLETEDVALLAADADQHAPLAAMGAEGWHRELPAWIAAWSEAEARRPWPPEI